MGALIENPITWVQLRLRGGWKNLLITTGVYALILFLAMGLWAQMDPKHMKDAAEGWTYVLLIIQIGLVLIFSFVRVASSVRQDTTSGIMESHRLMPVTGFTACLGFVIGPIAQMLAIGMVTFAAGVLSATVAGLSSSRWAISNGILLIFVIFLSSCSVFLGFYRKAIFNFIFVLAIAGLFSRGLLLFALPMMTVLATPLARESIFNLRGSGVISSMGLIWGFIGQALIAGIFLAAASRKFRQPQRPAFTVSLALIFLAAWVTLNLIGILQWDEFEPVFLRYIVGQADSRTCAQFAGSVLTAVLLSVLPIGMAVREHAERQSEKRYRASLKPVANLTPTAGDAVEHAGSSFPGRTLTILLCVALVCGLLLAPLLELRHPHWRNIGPVMFSIVCAVANLGVLVSTYRKSARKTASIVLLFLLFTWFVPLIADIVEHSILLDQFDSTNAPWSATAFGPIGTVLSPWNPEMQTNAGLACQAIVTLLMLLIAFITERARSRRSVIAKTPPPLPSSAVIAAAELPATS